LVGEFAKISFCKKVESATANNFVATRFANVIKQDSPPKELFTVLLLNVLNCLQSENEAVQFAAMEVISGLQQELLAGNIGVATQTRTIFEWIVENEWKSFFKIALKKKNSSPIDALSAMFENFLYMIDSVALTVIKTAIKYFWKTFKKQQQELCNSIVAFVCESIRALNEHSPQSDNAVYLVETKLISALNFGDIAAGRA
jgi:hypothetical protein